MTQQQHLIRVEFSDGSASTAHRTGNNAAWICACRSPIPILGYSDTIDAESENSIVVCPSPECGRRYRVVAPGTMQIPTRVAEIH